MSFKDINSSIIPPKIAGIRTNLPIYQLAWHINQSFSMDFAYSLPWSKQLESNSDTRSFHHHFFDTFEDVELNWHLINNKGTELYFLQTKPMFDALLICNGDDIYKYFERAVESIKLNTKIEFIHQFGFDVVKSKDSFFNNLIQTRQFIEDLTHV